MRITKLVTVVSTVLLGAAVAQAGDTKISQEKFTAADTDRDGSLTLAEAPGRHADTGGEVRVGGQQQ